MGMNHRDTLFWSYQITGFENAVSSLFPLVAKIKVGDEGIKIKPNTEWMTMDRRLNLFCQSGMISDVVLSSFIWQTRRRWHRGSWSVSLVVVPGICVPWIQVTEEERNTCESDWQTAFLSCFPPFSASFPVFSFLPRRVTHACCAAGICSWVIARNLREKTFLIPPQTDRHWSYRNERHVRTSKKKSYPDWTPCFSLPLSSFTARIIQGMKKASLCQGI